MTRYEYTVVAAPLRADKQKGVRTPADRFAVTLEQVLNDMARQGWDYVRAETLPSEERAGLTSRNTVWNNVLIFRRPVGTQAEAPLAPAPTLATPEPTPASPPAPPTAAEAPSPTANPFSEPMRALTPEASTP